MYQRILMLLCVMAALCLPAGAQTPAGYLPVSGSQLVDSNGTPIANAALCAQAMVSGQPASIHVGGAGNTTVTQVCTTITNGHFLFNLPNVSLTTPKYACFKLTAIDNVSGASLLTGYNCVQPRSVPPPNVADFWCTPSACNFDLLPPNYPASDVFVSPQGEKGDKGDTGEASVVTDNGANGDFSAASFNHSFLLSATTPMMDVRAFGATCNSDIDDTAHIQAAINVATAIGGIVYFPPCTFSVNGPVQASTNGILSPPPAPPGAATQLKLQGTTKIRQDSEGTGITGTVIKTNQTVGINFDSAIIAVAQNPVGFGFQNMDLYVSDIEFRIPPDPHVGCINAQWAAGADIEHIRCEVGEPWDAPSRTWPTYHLNGILLPGVNNDTLAVFKYSEVSGVDTGIVASEHSDIEESTFSFGNVGINYQAGYHTADAILPQLQDVGTPILFTGGSLPVNIQGLDIQQCIDVVPSRCNSGIDISDPNNFGYGHISYAKVGDDGSVKGKLVMDGGGNLDLYDMYNNQRAYGGAFQRATVTVGGGSGLPDANGIIADIAAEYWDIDTFLGSYAAHPELGAADPSRVGVLQVYQGGVKNTRGTLPGNLTIQGVSGGGTNIGNKGSDVNFGYIGIGAGFQVASGPGCTYTAGAIGNFCNTVITLPVAQDDTNYQISGCFVASTAATPFTGTPVASSAFALTTTTFTVTTSSLSTTGTGGGIVRCLVTHDAFR